MTRDNIILISYGVPFLAINVLTVVIMVSIRSRLSPTFFYIYMLTSAMNLLTYLNVWTQRLYQEQAFNFYYHFANWTGALPLINQFLLGFCYFAQNINSALLVIDRFVSVATLETRESWHDQWWLLPAILYILTGIGHFLAVGYYDPTYISAYVYVPSTDSFIKDNKSVPRIPWFVGFESVFGIAFIALCAYINIITWMRLSHSQSTKKADRSLFLISFTIFISQSFYILILVLYYSFHMISNNRLLGVVSTLFYTYDVFTLAPGLYVLLVPGPIRRQFTSLFRTSKATPNEPNSAVLTVAI